MLTAVSALLHWCVEHQPERTEAAGPLVFVEPGLALEVLDRAEAAGVTVERIRGFAVNDGTATPLPGQDLAPAAGELLDCETPSGASCGAARRTLRGQWMRQAPMRGRHMVLLDLDEQA